MKGTLSFNCNRKKEINDIVEVPTFYLLDSKKKSIDWNEVENKYIASLLSKISYKNR